MNKVPKRSEEVRKKISESCKRNGVGKWRIGMSPSNKGKSLSEETKRKISCSLKGRKMPYVSEANSKRIYSDITKAKRSVIMKSTLERLWSEDSHKQKMINVRKKAWKSKEYRDKNSGCNHYKWIKDRTLLKVDGLKKYDTQYKYWMLTVKKRDCWKCKINNQDCKGRLEAHHILPWKEYPEKRYDLTNGITLCHFHHPHLRSESEKQVELFKKLIQRDE